MSKNKPIIVLLPAVKEWQLKDLAQIANGYLIKTREELTEEDFASVEIMYGWNNDWADKLVNLKWIQKESAGVDSIPERIRNHSSIQLSNMSGIHAVPITENVFGYLLAKGRGIIQSLDQQRAQVWDRTLLDELFSLEGKVILIYGTGGIGSQIARTAKFFKMTTIGVNSNARSVESFDKTVTFEGSKAMLGEVDVVVNALPLTSHTEGIFDRDYFDQLSHSAHFINVGRGESVKQTDLINVLNEGKIAGAYLDVTNPEPLPANDPLWLTPNLVITPHISGTLEHFQEATFPILKENLIAYIKTGTIVRNVYNREVGY